MKPLTREQIDAEARFEVGVQRLIVLAEAELAGLRKKQEKVKIE